MQLEDVLTLVEIRDLSDEFTMEQYHKMADLESSVSMLTIARIRGNLVYEDLLRQELNRLNSRGVDILTMGKLNRLVNERVERLQMHAKEFNL